MENLSKTIAQTILAQLGGSRFLVMTGSKNLMYDTNALCMTLTRNKAKAKYLRIELDASDTYTMTFRKAADKAFNCKVITMIEGVYNDQLQDIFTEVTGLYTKL